MQKITANGPKILELEESIVSQILSKQHEVFGNQPITISREDPRLNFIQSYIQEVIKDFPRSSNSNNCYLKCSVSLNPILCIQYSKLRSKYDSEDNNALFAPEIAKFCELGPLRHKAHVFTEENLVLELRNLRFKDNRVFSNSLTRQSLKEKIFDDNTGFSYGKEYISGILDTSSSLIKMKMLADYTFGKFRQTNVEIDAEYHQQVDQVATLKIRLPSITAKIDHEGIAHFNDGQILDMEKLPEHDIGIHFGKDQFFINTNIQIDIEFFSS